MHVLEIPGEAHLTQRWVYLEFSICFPFLQHLSRNPNTSLVILTCQQNWAHNLLTFLKSRKTHIEPAGIGLRGIFYVSLSLSIYLRLSVFLFEGAFCSVARIFRHIWLVSE